MCDVNGTEAVIYTFSVLADETRDITNQEQFSNCNIWVDEEFTIHEDLIGLVHVERTDAD